MAVHMSVDFKSLSEIIGLQCRDAIQPVGATVNGGNGKRKAES